MAKKTVFDSLLELSGRGIPAEVEREGTKVSFKIIKPSLEIMDQYAAILAKEKDIDIEKDFRPAVDFLLINTVKDDEGLPVFENTESIRKMGFDLYQQMQKKVFEVLIDRKITDFERKNSEDSPSLPQQSP